ncbi:MAG: alpha/beta fold hydrolase [bacterium]
MSTLDPAVPRIEVLNLAHGPLSLTTAGGGPPLVVLHQDVGPFGWTAFHEALAERFTVYAPDMPGFGESPRAEWARHPRDLAAILLNAARHLGLGTYTLVGCGFGGWVAAEMAAFAHPELSALILVAPAGVKPEGQFILDQVLEDPFEYLRAGFSNQESFEHHFPDLKDKALRPRLDSARENIARVSWKPYMYSYELPETLRGAVELPVTVAWGTADRVIPVTAAQQYRAILPQASVRLFDGAGHFLELERPSELAELIASPVDAPA